MPLDGAPISLPPLPEGWSLSERVDDLVHADGLAIRRVGLCATSAYAQAVGSAAEVSESPAQRAIYELLERIALMEAARSPETSFKVRSGAGDILATARFEHVFPPSDAPDQWVFARSNGVSLHSEWTTACDSAAAELIERDRVLRAWMGETRPVRIANGSDQWVMSGTRSYDWRTYFFPAPDGPAVRPDLDVVGVFGFPRAGGAPLVLGFGARRNREDAIQSAQREALQSLAFLWGETIPEREPEPLPMPMTHLETYQVRDRHSSLLRWLELGHAAYHRRARSAADTSLRFADLTPPWLEGRLHVAKALCPAVIPMVFGRSPLLAHLPSELRIHPIP